jgi:hypothetical protein
VTKILDIVDGRLVHVVAVDGQVLSDAFPVPPTGPSDTRVGTFTVTPQDDRITIPNHGLANGDQVRFVLDDPNSCVLPFPLNDADYYFVVNARGNDFMVSSTAGGAVINITDKGVGTNEVWKHGGGGAPSNVQLFFVQSGRSVDTVAIGEVNHKFMRDPKGQIWYNGRGFLVQDRPGWSPVDIGALMPKV